MDEVEALLGTNRWIMKKWGLFFLLVIVRGLGIYICICIYLRERKG